MSEKSEAAAEHKAAEKRAADAPKSKEVLSEMEQGLPSATGEQQAAKKTERGPRDNRRIIQGVQFPGPGGVETITGNTPEDLDKLEARMTPEQCEYLKQQGAIEGDWSPAGKPAPPMLGSRAELATRAVKLGPSPDHAEVERLRAENHRLQAQIEKAKK